MTRGTSSGGELASWHVGEGNTIEGTSGQVGTVTRGEAKMHGRDEVAPLPN